MMLPASSLMRLSEIEVADGRRAVDQAKVAALAGSIGTVGLLNPVSVDKGGTLVAGGHRLAACRMLGWDEIPVIVLDLDADRQRLAELDENLVRAELSALERAESLAERKAIYERLHPEACARSSERQRSRALREPDDKLAPGFAADTAANTGLSERTVQRDVRTAQALAPDVRDAVRGTAIADNKSALAALAEEPVERQRELVAAGPEAVREVAAEKRASKLTAKERARLEQMARDGMRRLRGEPAPETADEAQDEDETAKPFVPTAWHYQRAIDAALEVLADEGMAAAARCSSAAEILRTVSKGVAR